MLILLLNKCSAYKCESYRQLQVLSTAVGINFVWILTISKLTISKLVLVR